MSTSSFLDELHAITDEVEHCADSPDSANAMTELAARFRDLHERWVAAVRGGGPAELERIQRCYDALDIHQIMGRNPALGVAQRWLAKLADDLRYAVLCRTSASACDCEAATALARPPTSPRETVGDEQRCTVCGARWAGTARVPREGEDFPRELRAILDDADRCSLAHPAGAPAALVAAIEQRFADLATRWKTAIANGRTGTISIVFDERCRWRKRIDEIPPAERDVSFEWKRVTNRWFKLRPGEPDPPLPDLRSAAGEAMDWLLELEASLASENARRVSRFSCDCDPAAAGSGRPSGPLTDLGEATDGYYMGTRYACAVCGSEWVSLIMDDSVGSARWERATGPTKAPDR